MGGGHHILQRIRTLLKGKEKGETHITFDEESAFSSHTPSLKLSHFVSSPEDVYIQSDECYIYINNTEDKSRYHAAFLSSMCGGCYENVDQNERDYSFLRLDSCECFDDSDIQYETLDFSVMSDIDGFGIDCSHCTDSVEPIALVAHVSYATGNDSTNWILDSGSTHHMNGFANAFFDMKLEGYDDGLLVKGLVSGTKAYGIGSCIVVMKDSDGMYHQICLEDVLYVPNLLHHHPRIFSVISACSQDECECHFLSNSYVLNIKLAKIELNLCKGLLWIPNVDPSTIPNFVIVIFKI